jgi:predicted PurR-regulated permease PerM
VNQLAKGSNKPNPAKLAPVSIGGVAVAKIFSISVLIAAIVVIGILFYQVMASFFVPLFLAALLVVIFRPLHSWISHRVKGGHRTAAVLTTTFIILLVLLPAGLIISVAAAQGTNFFRRLSAGGITESLDRIRKGLSLDLPSPDSFRQLDLDMDELAQPLPIANAKSRIQEVKDIVLDIHAELSIDPENDFSRDFFLSDLQTLKERLEEFAVLVDGDDSFAREQARKAYDTQYQAMLHSRRLWTQEMLGSSFMAQIKMLANPSDAELRSFTNGIQEFIQPRVLPLTQMASQFVFQTIVAVVILVIALYFFFADGNSMVQTFMRLSPLDDEYERRLLLQFDQTSRAVVLASVLSAIAQGILAAIAFWFAGLPSIVLLFIATTFMGLVPFLGAASVWVPCAIYLGAVEHRWGAAIALAIFGATIISSIDNVIKVFVLQGHSQLHPLLALLSVLGGLQVFGPIGILVGPMVVVFLQTLLEILNNELEGRAKHEAPNEAV